MIHDTCFGMVCRHHQALHLLNTDCAVQFNKRGEKIAKLLRSTTHSQAT